jgi:hypothetical protein
MNSRRIIRFPVGITAQRIVNAQQSDQQWLLHRNARLQLLLGSPQPSGDWSTPPHLPSRTPRLANHDEAISTRPPDPVEHIPPI